MQLNEVIFIESLPSLDLHGYDRDSARVRIIEFINDNIKLKNEIICIVHGVGTGIIKEETHKVLKKNNNVVEYKLFYKNIGCTIVKLKI